MSRDRADSYVLAACFAVITVVLAFTAWRVYVTNHMLMDIRAHLERRERDTSDLAVKLLDNQQRILDRLER